LSGILTTIKHQRSSIARDEKQLIQNDISKFETTTCAPQNDSVGAQNPLGQTSSNTLVVIGGHVHQFLPASSVLWQLFAGRARYQSLKPPKGPEIITYQSASPVLQSGQG